MRHVSLFTGIGGFELAAQRVWGDAWEPVFFCEKDDYCRRVLAKHWPDVPIVEDVRDVTTNAEESNDRSSTPKSLCGQEQEPRVGIIDRGVQGIDLLTGGFPCQPFSAAGKRDGKSDDRHLWPEMLRIIQLLKPTWIVAENVRGLLSIEDGVVFEQVCTDLEGTGYDVQPFVIPAVAVDAHHRRDRIWFVGHRHITGCEAEGELPQPVDSVELSGGRIERTNVAHSNCRGQCGQSICQKQSQRAEALGTSEDMADPTGKQWRARENKSINSGHNGSKSEHRRRWLPEPDVGRVANGVPMRVDRLRSLGNAIVPQVAEMIFRAIKDTEESNA